MQLVGKRIAFLVGPEFEDLEFWAVYMRLIEEGAEVTVVGLKAGEVYRSKSGGLTATAEVAAADVGPDAFDAVVIPGGWAPDKLRRYEAVTALVRGIYEQGKIVGMICHAGLVGISARIVAGHRATGSLGIKDDLINAGATWVDEPAFRDGNIVWGRVVPDIPAFNRELVKALAS
ncbi:MAG: type 1 glutamine amidotransferase [Caldilineales bacterium]|nr:type 1 glutamine amidotransferase [Caldilineales bacterium]